MTLLSWPKQAGEDGQEQDVTTFVTGHRWNGEEGTERY